MKKFLILNIFVFMLGISFFGLFVDSAKAISSISVGTTPIYSTTVGTKVYVSNQSSNNVSVIDTTTDTVLTTIPVGTTPYYSTTVGTKLYVNNWSSNNVSVIDTVTDTVLTTISVGTNPPSSTAVGTKLYVNNYSSNNISVIDTTTNTVLTTISVGSHPLSSTAVGTKLYVNNSNSTNISVIDTTNNTVLTTISVGSYPNSSTIVGTKLYVNNLDSNNVSVIDTTNNTMLTTISVGSYPNSSTTVGTKLYVNNSGSNNVSVIDTTTDTILTTISVGIGPYSSTAVGTKLYVSNWSSNNVSVIDTTTIAPIFSSAGVLGTNLTLMYSYALDSNSIPAIGDFAVKVNGNAVTVSAVNITGKKVILTLASAPSFTDIVTVSYTKGASPIQDTTGSASLDLTNEAVKNLFVGTQILYGSDGAGNNDNVNLYTLDPETGARTAIGLTGHNINGMDFDPTTGILYGNTSNGDNDGDQTESLFTIDTATGLATFLGQIQDADTNSLPFPDIAFRSDGRLYGWSVDDYSLYTISTDCPDEICLATLISEERMGAEFGGGLAFDSQDHLYLFSNEEDSFYQLNPDTGELIDEVTLPNPSGDGLYLIAAKFDANDTLFASRGTGYDPTDLIRIDINTGEITSTGEDNPSMLYMTALAFYLLPDPTCTDGIQNQDETGIDEGGVCTPEPEPEPEPIPVVHHISSGSSASLRYNNLLAMGNISAAQALAQQFPNQITTPPTIIAGCDNRTIGFSTTTGQSCLLNTGTPITIIAGCDNRTTGFSTTTGQSCLLNTGTTISPTLNEEPIIYNFGPTTLKNGSVGEAVKELQRFLNAKLNLGLVVDGNFGPKTKAVVVLFQKANSLVPDGLVGKLTKAKMNGM